MRMLVQSVGPASRFALGMFLLWAKTALKWFILMNAGIAETVEYIVRPMPFNTCFLWTCLFDCAWRETFVKAFL